jgi:hypothetical protein
MMLYKRHFSKAAAHPVKGPLPNTTKIRIV